MNRRFEKSLSQVLSVVVLILFIITIISSHANIFAINYIWAIGFLIAWVLMLVYAIYILFQTNSYGLSIFTAIITAIGFGVLSVPAILVLARFIPVLPVGLNFNNKFLNLNNQFILYTVLIVIYFIHILNIIKLKNKREEYKVYSDNEDNSPIINDNLEENNEDYDIITNNTDDKTVFVSDIDQEVEYNTEKVDFVEELTDEDLELMEGEDNNG
jgi:hypothetical protein